MKVLRTQDPASPSVALPVTSSGGHIPTLMIAANDSTDADKAIADYVCTGADDQVTFNQALQALPPYVHTNDNGSYHHTYKGRGRLVVAEGIYYIRDSIILDRNTTLMGFGSSSIIRADPIEGDGGTSTSFSLVKFASWWPYRQNIRISDLVFDGNDLNISDTTNRISGITLFGEYVIVEGCHFYQCSFRGINFDYEHPGAYHQIINNAFEDCALWREGRPDDNDFNDPFNARAAIGGTSEYSMITGNKFTFNDYDSIFMNASVFTVISNNEMSDAAFHMQASGITLLYCRGISVVANEGNSGWTFCTLRTIDVSSYKCDSCSITANNWSSGGGTASGGETFATIRLIGGSNGLIRSNSIQANNLEGGILLNGVKVADNHIDGNFIQGNINGPVGDRSGITLLNGASRNKITNNMIRPTNFSYPNQYGVFIGVGCTDNWVAMNDVHGCWLIAGIQDNGTTTDTTPYNRV